MNGNTPRAPQGIKIPPLPDAPVRFETGEGQSIRVSVYARGFNNPWSMAWVSDDTMLVAERGGAIKVVRNGVVDPQPVPGAPGPWRGAVGHGPGAASGLRAQSLVYISYTKPLDPRRGPSPRRAGWSRRWPCSRARSTCRGWSTCCAAAAPPAAAPRGRARPDEALAGKAAGPRRTSGGRGGGQPTTLAVARAVWNGKGFTDLKDIFVGEGGSGGPIVFGGEARSTSRWRRRHTESQDSWR